MNTREFDFNTACKLKRDLIDIIKRDTLIDCASEDVVALAKGLATKGWVKP